MSCKLYLVPEDIIQKWKSDNRNQQVNEPVQHTINKIDEKMQNILRNPDLNIYDKEKMYSQKLGDYINMRDNQHISKQWSNSTLDSVPKKFQTKAKALMNYMQSDDEITWDNLDQLVLKGKVIPKSNVLDLLHDSLRARKTSKKPKGWRELSKHFRSKNIPQEIIGNAEWTKENDDVEEGNISTDDQIEQDNLINTSEESDWRTPPNSPFNSHKLHAIQKERTSRKRKRTPERQSKIRERAPERKSKIRAEKRIKHWINLIKS